MTTAATIQRYYQTLLNRTGSTAEVAGWVDLVDNAGIPIQQVQLGFINSYEALQNILPIVEMYQDHLGRVPDQGGLAYWSGLLQSGALTMAQIGLALANSAESQAYYGTAYDANFVTSLYQNVLGREPEAGAVDGWLAAKQSGLTQPQIQELFRTSTEAGVRAAPAVTNFLTAVAQSEPLAYSGSLYSVGRTITLTTGHDYGRPFTGTSGNDTFQAVEDTATGSPIPVFTTADAIDGGAGVNTLNVTQTAAISGMPLSATVNNIQIANVIDASTVTLDTTAWTGLAALNVTANGATNLTASGTTGVTVIDNTLGTSGISITGGAAVTVTASGESVGNGGPITIGGITAPTGPVTVTVSSNPNGTSSGSLGTIQVRGGSVVNVTENVLGAANRTVSAGSIFVQGTAATTSVTASQTAARLTSSASNGVTNAFVSIVDVNGGTELAGTITLIAARNYTTLSISDNALTTLSLAGGSGNIIIDNSGPTVPTNQTLALTIDGQTGGTLDDADIYTTLNVTTASNNSTLANITQGALTALTVAGTNRLRLTSTAGLSALQSVAVSGSAGLTADFSGSGTLTSVDTSATTGASTLTINGSRVAFTGGAGADAVTLQAGITHALSLGDGDDSLVIGSFVPTAALSGGTGIDTLSMDSTAAVTASYSGTFAGLVTGFEKLTLTGATNQAINLSALGIANAVQTRGGNGLTLSNSANGSTLTLDGAGTAYTVGRVPGGAQSLNLVLTDGSTAGVAFATTGITAAGIQTIAITTADTQATPTGIFNDSVTLLGNASTTITVAGNAGLALTATSTAATTVDASGITLGGFTYTSGALASAAVIKGSTAGTNTVDFTSANAAVTYTGGGGGDNITANNIRANLIDTGAGNDTVTVGNGNNTINTGDGSDFVLTGSGTNTITAGAGAKSLTLGSGSNTVTLAAHGTGTSDSISVAATTSGSYVPTAIITGLNTVGSDTITFAGDTATTFTSFTAGQLITFGNALGNNGTAGSAPPTLAAAVADMLGSLGGNLAQHGIGAFQYSGNTYLVEQHGAAGTAFAATDTLIELTGLQTFNTTSVTGGVLRLLT